MFSRKIGGHVCGMSTFYEYVSEYVLSHTTEHFLWKCLWGNVCGMSWLTLSLSPSLSRARALSLSLSSSLSVHLALPLSFPLFISLSLSLSLTHTLLHTHSLPPFLSPSLPRSRVCARALSTLRQHADETQANKSAKKVRVLSHAHESWASFSTPSWVPCRHPPRGDVSQSVDYTRVYTTIQIHT